VILEITPPPVEASYCRTPVWHRIAVYSVGLISATTAVGAAVGAIGSVASPLSAGHQRLWTAGIAVITLVYALHEFELIRLPIPQVRWQVPVQWSKYGKTVQVLLYGIVLGAEIFTFIPYATFYILLLLEMTLGPQIGATLGFMYGLARAYPVAMGIADARARGTTTCVIAHIARSMTRFHVANGVVLAAVGEVIVALLVKG